MKTFKTFFMLMDIVIVVVLEVAGMCVTFFVSATRQDVRRCQCMNVNIKIQTFRDTQSISWLVNRHKSDN